MTVLLKKFASSSLAVGLIVVTATNAVAAPQREASGLAPVETSSAVTSPQVPVSFARTSVSSTPAPVKEAPVVAPQSAVPAKPEVSTTETSQAPVAKKTLHTTTPVPAAAAPAPAPATPSGSRGAGIAAAALSQIGVAQDCTALVERSLRAVGVVGVGDESPASLLRFASPVFGTPQVGDLIFYANGGTGFAHIAVYIGNGQAVHGGWNGYTTAIAPANVGSGPVYYRVA